MMNATAYIGSSSTSTKEPMTQPTIGPKVGRIFVTPTITEISTTFGRPAISMKIALTIPTPIASRIVKLMYLLKIALLLLRKSVCFLYCSSVRSARRKRSMPRKSLFLPAMKYTARIIPMKVFRRIFHTLITVFMASVRLRDRSETIFSVCE